MSTENAPSVDDTDSHHQQWIDAYLLMLKTEARYSIHTQKSARLDLHELTHFLDTYSAKRLTQITHHDIRHLIAKLHAKGLNPRSIARKLSSYRQFFDWLGKKIPMPNNPAQDIRAPKLAKTLPKALGVDDAVRLVSEKVTHIENEASQLATTAVIELLYSSGLRISEIVNLNLYAINPQAPTLSSSYVDFSENQVKVLGKGNKERIVPVGRAAITALQAYIAARPQLVSTHNPNEAALFLNERGARLSARTLQHRVKAHAKQCGIPTVVHPHVLRHSFASHLLQSSGDLRAVQELLGHESIAATQVYTALDFQHLSKVYDQTHPRAKKKT